MKKNYGIILLIVNLFSIQGCTNIIYQGEIDALSSKDQQRKVILYWSKTEKFIGDDKAGPAILMTECSSRRLTFVEKENGIVFLGTPGLDIRANQKQITSQDEVCGKIVNEKMFDKIQAGLVNVEIYCSANIGEFSIINEFMTPRYIKVSKEPYTFEINETSQWSFFGETPDAPAPPECRH